MRKFKVFLLADNFGYNMIRYSTVGDTKAADLIQIILNMHKSLLNVTVLGQNFQVLTYRSEKWLKNDDLINKLSSKESILVIVAESMRNVYSVEDLKAVIDFFIEMNPKFSEQFHGDQPGLNDVVMLKPNISGIGLDINKLIDSLKGRK